MDKEDLKLASSRSRRISLQSVREKKGGLDARRNKMLERVPNPGDWGIMDHKSLRIMDLAYLTAATGDEFAILRGKHEDVLFHGTSLNCTFTDELAFGIRSHKYELIGHSHNGEDEPKPSPDDRAFLMETGQERSMVISARTGRITDYTADPFEGRYTV